MKKLNITKEQFNKSRYFQKKYGKLEYVSESGKLFKTSKGKVLKFVESKENTDPQQMDLLEKIGDYLTSDYGVDNIQDYQFGPRIYFDLNDKKYYVEVGYSDNQPMNEKQDDRSFADPITKEERKFVKESGEELYAEINIWPDDLQMWDDLLNEQVDYDEYGFDEESTVFQETAQFEDGCFADLKVNTNDREDGTLWAEVVLFDEDGHQLAYSEPNYSGISGEWELEADGKTYIVSVGSR